MTLGQLRKRVDELIGEHGTRMNVIMSKDPEGNGFNPAGDFDDGGIYEDHEYRSHPDDIEPDEKKNAVCLWPD